MDSFLDYLIKKSDIGRNEYFNYRQPSRKAAKKLSYEKITEPTAESYVVFDFETTGMNPELNRIIEIGAEKITNNEVTGSFNALIDPEQYIPYSITRITHITNDSVADRPTISTVLPKFCDFVEDMPLVAHNAPFDMSFLLANCQRENLTLNNPAIDTLYLSRKYNKECEKHNLAYLTDYFDIKLKNAHRAYFDALAKIIQQKYYSLIDL